MDLWIRSQDRLTMMKVNDIRIIDYRGLKEQLQKSILSFMSDMDQMKSYLDKDGWGLSCNETCLGIYETKERALSVLDEIQNLIKPRIITTNYECEIKENLSKLGFDLRMIPQKAEIQELSTIVYEMPKE